RGAGGPHAVRPGLGAADPAGTSPRGRAAGQAGGLRRVEGEGGHHVPRQRHPNPGRPAGETRRAGGEVCMTETTLTIECAVHFDKGKAGAKRLAPGPQPPAVPAGRVPRVARLLALAHRFEGLLRQGAVKDYAELARLGHVTRARITQLMNLL